MFSQKTLREKGSKIQRTRHLRKPVKLRQLLLLLEGVRLDLNWDSVYSLGGGTAPNFKVQTNNTEEEEGEDSSQSKDYRCHRRGTESPRLLERGVTYTALHRHHTPRMESSCGAAPAVAIGPLWALLLIRGSPGDWNGLPVIERSPNAHPSPRCFAQNNECAFRAAEHIIYPFRSF
jgi:hypothetical protein